MSNVIPLRAPGREPPLYFERHEIYGKEWLVDYMHPDGSRRYRFFAEADAKGSETGNEWDECRRFAATANGRIVGLMNDPAPFGPWLTGRDGKVITVAEMEEGKLNTEDPYNHPYFDAYGNLKPEYRVP